MASFSWVKEGWSPESILDRIASAPDSRRLNALIDTGALVTGYSNEEVARELLRTKSRGSGASRATSPGLPWAEGVIFLDSNDAQQVLVRATGRVVPADQCGVPLEKRFAFYDQVRHCHVTAKSLPRHRPALRSTTRSTPRAWTSSTSWTPGQCSPSART